MDSIKLAGFKESLEKEASVGGLLRLTRRKATKLISKGKGALDDAKVGYEGGKSGIGWTPRSTAAGKAGQFAGKHRKAIAGTTGVASGAALVHQVTKEASEEPGYFKRQAIGAKALTGGGIIRNKEDIKDNINIAGTHLVPNTAVGAGTGAIFNKLLNKGSSRRGALIGAGIGAAAGLLSGSGAIAEKDHQRLKAMGFETSRLTGVKKVPKKYLKD